MSKKGTRALASATLMSLVLTTALSAGPVKAAAGQVTRVGESDRYATAAKVATTNWTTSDNVVLVSGEGYADAVSASALAKKLNAPILLTTAGSLNADAKAALSTLKAKNIYVVGGNASVSAAVRADLKANYTLVELQGTNRYETNVAVAKELVKLGVDPSNVMMVGGEGFSDALSVAPIAAAKGQILLLGNSNADSMKSVIDFVNDNKSKVTVVGTTNVISDAILNAVSGTRIDGGASRFDTNLKVLAAFKDTVKMDKLFVANASGNGYADALVASALAGTSAAPLVLVGGEGEDATVNAIAYIKANATTKTDLNVVGGTGVVSDATVSAINGAVNPSNPVFTGEITSVEAVENQTVNCKANDETLKFTVNGGRTATVDDVVDAGYEVKFVADEKVFDGKDTDSKDGKLDKTLLRNLYNTGDVDNSGDYSATGSKDYFKYQVVIEKDGQIVAQSAKIEVKIINAETTATSIGDVTIKLGTKGDSTGNTTLSSNKLVDTDVAFVDEVKGNSVDGKNNITITNVKYYSSNPFVAEVTEDGGIITAKNKGDFKLIIKSGSTTKEISMSVVTDARKVNSATAAVSSIKMAKKSTMNVEFVLKDQYGDPIKNAEFEGTSVTTDQAFGIADVKDGDKVIASVTTATGTTTDKKGKIKLDITNTTGDTGKGTLKVKTNNGKNIVSIPVEIVAGGNVDTYKVEKVGDDKDFTLDLNPEAADKDGNSQVKVKINKYDKNGVFLGTVINDTTDDNNITIELAQPKNTNILDESQVDNKIAIDKSKIGTDGTLVLDTRYEDGASNEVFALRDNKPAVAETGTLTLTIKKGSEVKTTVNVTVKDSSPVITNANIKDLSVKHDDVLNLEDIMKGEDISVSRSAGEGHVIIANNGTIFMNYTTDGDVKGGDFSDITTDSAITFTPGKDIYLGEVLFTSEDGRATASLSDGKVTFNNDDTRDHYVLVGIKKAHDKAPFKTVRILVSGK